MRLIVILATILTQALSVIAFQDGASIFALGEDGFPHHGVAPLTGISPFVLQVNATSYNPSDVIEVTLKGINDEEFKGFLIFAKRVSGDLEENLGTFSVDEVNSDKAKVISWDQGNGDDGATHRDNSAKTQVTVLWTAPSTSQGDVYIKAVAVEDVRNIWMNLTTEKIAAVEDDESPPFLFPVGGDIEPLNTSSCGNTMGCFLYPEGCSGSECHFVVGYTTDSDDMVHFQIQGNDEDYVAIGISDDKTMGDDEVYTCVEAGGAASFQHGYNPGHFNIRRKLDQVVNMQITRQDGIIYCSFSRPAEVPMQYTAETKNFTLKDNWHIQVATSATYGDSIYIKKHEDLPLTSETKVDFESLTVVSAPVNMPPTSTPSGNGGCSLVSSATVVVALGLATFLIEGRRVSK